MRWHRTATLPSAASSRWPKSAARSCAIACSTAHRWKCRAADPPSPIRAARRPRRAALVFPTGFPMTTLAFIVLLVATVAGYMINRQAARAVRGTAPKMHSLVSFHALYSALVVLVPVLVLILLWLGLAGPVVDRMIMAGLPDGVLEGLDTGGRQLVLAEIKSISRGR